MGYIYSKKVEYDGIKFDSEMECEYYKFLKHREQLGEIDCLEVHYKFELQPAFVNAKGIKKEPIIYECDFHYYDELQERWRTVDVKGMLTDDFALKWKMFEFKYGRELEVLKYSKSTGWVNYEDYKKARKTYKQQLVVKKNEAIKKAKEIEKQRKAEQKDLERYFTLLHKEKRSKAENERMKQLYLKHHLTIDKYSGKEVA